MKLEQPLGAGDETHVDEPYLSILWRSVPRMLYAEWKGFATSAEMRAAMMTGLKAIRERHVLAYVSDARRAKVFLPEDDLWERTCGCRRRWLPASNAWRS
jgi:hypothetical protein